ncbi:unnamed protein product [Sphagnum compactum]
MKGGSEVIRGGGSSVSVVEAGMALCEHVQRQGLQGHLFSDITLICMGKEYHLHRIILSQSSYFYSLLSGPWKENGKPRIELQIDDPNVSAEGLEIAFAYMYGVNPKLSGENAMAALAAGCFLCMENLCDKCVQFIVADLRVDTFVPYQQLSERHCYGRFADSIRNACWTFLCTHASRELVHLLPKLSLQVLCRLLKSDELWVLSETERYKLAKQALLDWKLARVKPTSLTPDCPVAKKTKAKAQSNRKSARNLTNISGSNKKAAHKATRLNSKAERKRKDAVALSLVETVKDCSLPSNETVPESDLRRLQRLWEVDEAELSKDESFKVVAELFTGGGIIFAHMEADEVLLAKNELQEAFLPTDAANDSMWHSVLLQCRVLKFRETHNQLDESSEDDEDEDEMDDEEEDDDDDDDEVDDDDDDDEEASDRDTSDSDGWSSDHSSQEDDDSNSSANRDGTGAGLNAQAFKRLKTQSTSLVSFSSADTYPPDGVNEKCWRTTGGFTWMAKPNVEMQLADFPPFRFGAEFVFKDKCWTPCLDLKSREVFYGGSMWKIIASNINQDKSQDDWLFGVHCRPLDTWEPTPTYQDSRQKVRFMAKLYIKTCHGLRCVTGTAVCKMRHQASHVRHAVGMHLSRTDVVDDEPLRVSAVVQLIDD